MKIPNFYFFLSEKHIDLLYSMISYHYSMVQDILDSKEKSKKSNYKPLIQCLSDCDLGSELIVLNVNTGKKSKKRLAHLGIIPGEKIIMKNSAPFSGPIEITVKGSSLVIGRGLASKIIVNCGESCNS